MTPDNALPLPPAASAGEPAPLPWLRPVVAAAVLLLLLLGLADLLAAYFTRSMPPSHYVVGPIAFGVMAVIWIAELAGVPWPLLVFAGLVTLPNVWLAAIGHVSVNFLYLMLTVAWVTYRGSRTESLIALTLNLAVVELSVLLDSPSVQAGAINFVLWAAGLVQVWLLTRALVSQLRLADELRAAQRDLTRQVAENQGLRAAAEQRLRDIEALYRADESLYGALRTDRVLQALVDVVADVLQVEQSLVLTCEATSDHLIVAASRGFSEEALARLRLASPGGVVAPAIRDRRPLALPAIDAAPEADVLLRTAAAGGARSALLVPILAGDRVFGVLVAGYRQARDFADDEQRLFLALAQRTSLALENARLYEQARQTALLEERQRLARELHDAVTQTLYSSSLVADVLPRLWERDPAAARRSLEELRALTRGALAEMRTLLYELRPTALTETPLGDLLRQLVEATRGHARLPVALNVDGQRPLPPDVQVALYRIAQEALNNVKKHAAAGHADVSLIYRADGVELCVRDDGQGFERGQIPAGRLGVGIMGERATAVGAGLAIASRPGQGTRVTVTWPAAGRMADHG